MSSPPAVPILDDDDDDDDEEAEEEGSSGAASSQQSDLGLPSAAAPSSTPPRVLLSDTPLDLLPKLPAIYSSAPPAHLLMPSDISPLLRCPLCNLPFDVPNTLHCGHTICSSHLKDPCPVPSCSPPGSSTPPSIPTSSSVVYLPAESPAPAFPPTLTPHVDVTLSKIISLVSCVETELEHLTADKSDDGGDDDGDGGDGEPSTRASSTSRVRHRRHSSASPPRVRKRRRYSPGPDDDDDLLSHLRRQTVVQRFTPRDEPLIPFQSPSTRQDVLSRFEKDLLVELTCDICCVLFFQPITTPCQHTFCYKCLHRSLDHSIACPICRQDLPDFAYFQDHPENKILMSIILKVFPSQYKERGDAMEAEEREARLDTPIFVCQLSFPGMPTLLHFFEPRYRLMLRRCLESPNPRFGMIMPPKPGSSSHQEYGTMLEIRQVQMMPDGRSMVETWGTFRFRLLESGTLDGYMVGRIERIDDYPEDIVDTVQQPEEGQEREPPSAHGPEATPTPALSSSSTTSPPAAVSSTFEPTSDTDADPDSEPKPSPRQLTNSELMHQCRIFLDHLQRGTAPWVAQRLRSTYGAPPTDPSSFSFFVAFVLPIDEQEKAKLLPIRSPRLRLLLVVHWIEQLNNNWYKERTLMNCILLMVLSVSFFYLRAAGGAGGF